ncbi:MAG: carbohydrate kinase family protein [Promethearchaeota archaeon]
MDQVEFGLTMTGTIGTETKKVACVGDLVLDALPTPIPACVGKEKILVDGETFVDDVAYQRGGCGGNFAATLAAMAAGVEVHLFSTTGDDHNADFLETQLREVGVVPHLERRPGEKTGTTFAISYPDGDRHFITCLGALESMRVEYFGGGGGFLSGFDHVAWRGPWFTPILLEQGADMLREARELGATTSMDLGFDPYWNADDDKAVEARKGHASRAFAHVDYLFGNEFELREVTGAPDLDGATAKVIDAGAGTVVVHRGKRGALVVPRDGNPVEIPNRPVEVVRNPTGAGDAFDAAFVACRLRGLALDEAGRLANEAARALISSPPGTRITLGEIERWSVPG